MVDTGVIKGAAGTWKTEVLLQDLECDAALMQTQQTQWYLDNGNKMDRKTESSDRRCNNSPARRYTQQGAMTLDKTKDFRHACTGLSFNSFLLPVFGPYHVSLLALFDYTIFYVAQGSCSSMSAWMSQKQCTGSNSLYHCYTNSRCMEHEAQTVGQYADSWYSD